MSLFCRYKPLNIDINVLLLSLSTSGSLKCMYLQVKASKSIFFRLQTYFSLSINTRVRLVNVCA